MNEPEPPKRPLVWTALRPATGNCDELRRALASLHEQGPIFSMDDEDVDGQVVIRAMNELDVESICERLAREHGAYVECGEANVIYLETIRDSSAAEAEFMTQSGGRGYYAHVAIQIESNPTKEYEFVNEAPEAAIPTRYIGSIYQGIRYGLKAGVFGGYEMVDVKVTLRDGSYHETDSDADAFETAGFMAVKDAVRRANPVLLEPLMSLQVSVPNAWSGAVVSDLKLRRADITGIESGAEERVVHAIVRLAKIIGYAADLRSITQGRGAYAATFLRYGEAQGLPSSDNDGIGVTANKPWKPKPKRGAVAVEPPWQDANY